MKNILVLGFLLWCSQVSAENKYTFLQYNPATGDTKFDLNLKDLNIRAQANVNNFVSTLGVKFDVSTDKIDHLMVNYNFTPADTYMTLRISEMTDKSIHDVAHAYKDNRSGGWGSVAKEMGIKLGSREFHQLKDGMYMDEVNSGNKAKGKNKKKNKNKKAHKSNRGQSKGRGRRQEY